jgi:hypothetical protein
MDCTWPGFQTDIVEQDQSIGDKSEVMNSQANHGIFFPD